MRINEWDNASNTTIFNIQVSAITDTSARVSWDTDRASWGQIEYGTDDQYGSATPLDKIPNLSHTMLIEGLLPGTTYHYRITATDLGRRATQSPDEMFTTTGTPSRIGDWEQFEHRPHSSVSPSRTSESP